MGKTHSIWLDTDLTNAQIKRILTHGQQVFKTMKTTEKTKLLFDLDAETKEAFQIWLVK